MSEEERRQVLEMVQSGKISAEQGLELLKVLREDDDALSLPASDDEQPASSSSQPLGYEAIADLPPDDQSGSSPDPGLGTKHWRDWWWIPLWIGVGVTIVSGILMFLAYQSGGFGFWFACTWFPFLLGVAVMALAATSRTAHWLHIRIKQKPGESPQKIAFSFPIPVRFTGWFLRTFKHTIPGLNEIPNMDEMLKALDKVSPDAPFYVNVDEGDGERVEVYIA